MARRSDFDVAILGGGLAGLSLAVRLARQPDKRVVVLEPRPSYRRDRTWCYWRLHAHPFEAAVATSWSRWDVSRRAGGGRSQTTTRGSTLCPYDMIPADRLYAEARAAIAASGNVELRLGCEASRVAEHPGHVEIGTTDGPLTADLAFDSRPPAPRPGSFAQRFLGQEVEAARPVFDPGRVTLMDFAVPEQPGAVHFLYVLPTSPTSALVEDTWLAPSGMPLPDHRAAIRAYIGARFGIGDYAVTFEEEGAIPMDPGLQAPAASGRVVPLGTAGGAVKPSSGYAFLAIQRMADALARDLAEGRVPRPFQPRTATARWMDEIFLTAVRERPEEAPRIFHSLFARCRPEPLLRFLNDVGGPADIAAVIAAMPKLVMIAAAARHSLSR